MKKIARTQNKKTYKCDFCQKDAERFNETYRINPHSVRIVNVCKKHWDTMATGKRIHSN